MMGYRNLAGTNFRKHRKFLIHKLWERLLHTPFTLTIILICIYRSPFNSITGNVSVSHSISTIQSIQKILGLSTFQMLEILRDIFGIKFLKWPANYDFLNMIFCKRWKRLAKPQKFLPTNLSTEDIHRCFEILTISFTVYYNRQYFNRHFLLSKSFILTNLFVISQLIPILEDA